MPNKSIGVLALVLFVLTLLWLVFMLTGVANYGIHENFDELLSLLSKGDALFYVAYVNAALITAIVTLLFASLFVYCKAKSPVWAVIALIFVPVYSFLNLISYLSQVTLVPYLMNLSNNQNFTNASEVLLRLTVQQWPQSFIWFMNNLAYAVLGIPSVVFGIILIHDKTLLKIAGVLLSLNGIACIIGVAGVLMHNDVLSVGSALGGAIYLVALIPLSIGFLRK
jgi:hypothetical protein